MRSFDYGQLADRMWDMETLSYVAKIHECKGRQELYVRQKPAELDRLVEIARIQSTEASNKIEGIVTTDTRMKQLLADKTTPRNRDESEIMGYREVLNTIHENHELFRGFFICPFKKRLNNNIPYFLNSLFIGYIIQKLIVAHYHCRRGGHIKRLAVFAVVTLF